MNSLIKEVKTQRKESLTEMDVLPHSTDIFNGEDWVGSRGQKEVSDRMVVEFCVQDLLDSVEEVLYKETCSEHSVLTEEDFNLHLGHRYTGTCSHCLADYYMVEQRCADIYENPPDYLSMNSEGEMICQSCNYDGKRCECCGISEKLVKTQCDRTVKFVEIEGAFPPQYLCDECKDYEEDHEELLTEMNEVFETYRGEYEIDTDGDPSLLQDDEETKTTKEIMKEVMDEMFDVSSDISENVYMNIVNKMKQVYERL